MKVVSVTEHSSGQGQVLTHKPDPPIQGRREPAPCRGTTLLGLP